MFLERVRFVVRILYPMLNGHIRKIVIIIADTTVIEKQVEMVIKHIKENMYRVNGGNYMTNGDRIRQMSNEELRLVVNCSCCAWFDECKEGTNKEPCGMGIKAYLESEEE